MQLSRFFKIGAYSSLKKLISIKMFSSFFIFQVYLYEYDDLSKPVDKPRQCLPYAIVTVKFIGQKVDNGHLMTSLRFLSTGVPKRAGKIHIFFYFSNICAGLTTSEYDFLIHYEYLSKIVVLYLFSILYIQNYIAAIFVTSFAQCYVCVILPH